MKKVIASVLAFLLTVIGLGGSAFAASSEPVKLCAYEDLGAISPYKIESDAQYELVRYVFDSLYYMDERNKSTEMMGHSLWISEDFKEYRITLRDDIKWHDGSNVTVDDVIYSYTNAKNVEWFKHCVRALDTVSAEGNTIIFKLKYSDPVFVKEAVVYMPIVPKSYYEKGEYVSIGCGAFKVEENRDNKVVLRATDYYLKETTTDAVKIDRLENEDACVNAVLENKYATVFGGLTADGFEKIRTKINDGIRISGLTSKMLFINNEKMSDVNLRKAISTAIDYDKIVNELYYEHATKGSYGFFNTDLGYANTSLEAYTNVDEAKQLLTSNGYTFNGNVLNDKNGNAVAVNILTQKGKNEHLANVVKDGMTGIGIDAQITVVEEDKLMSEVRSGNYHTAIVDLPGYYQYVESNLNLMLNNEYANYSRFNSQNVNDKLNRYQNQMDAYVRYDNLLELQDAIGKETPFIALCYPNQLNAYQKSLYDMYVIKDGVGIHSVLSFVSNEKYVVMKNTGEVKGAESGNTLLATGVVLGFVALGFGVYFVVNRKKEQ